MSACFVTGTDTGIGKTMVASALVYLYARAGARAVGMKPVAAGAERVNGQWCNEDVGRLGAASSIDLPQAVTAPYLLRTPAAPHIAAQIEDVAIEPARLLEAFAELQRHADCVIVEGVGGFRVPLADGWDTADLARTLQLPVVLVVGLRLGCINHALLTAEAVLARGLELVGWVANSTHDDMPYEAENIQAIAQRLNAPLWGHVPRLSGTAPEMVLRYLDTDLVHRRLNATPALSSRSGPVS